MLLYWPFLFIEKLTFLSSISFPIWLTTKSKSYKRENTKGFLFLISPWLCTLSWRYLFRLFAQVHYDSSSGEKPVDSAPELERWKYLLKWKYLSFVTSYKTSDHLLSPQSHSQWFVILWYFLSWRFNCKSWILDVLVH